MGEGQGVMWALTMQKGLLMTRFLRLVWSSCAASVALLGSVSAWALAPLSDDSLSASTGQDGLTMTLITPSTGITARVVLHDKDGLAPNGVTGSAGALIFGDGTAANNFKISSGSFVLKVDADGGAAGAGALLNLNLALPSDLVISTGTLSIGKSVGMGSAPTNTSVLMDNMNISLGGLTANIQLGNEAQGSMLRVSGAISNGITLSNVTLRDNWNGATAQSDVGIGVGTIRVRDSGGSALTLGRVSGDISAAGLVFNFADMGSASGIDIQMTGVKLGDQTAATKLGNLELRGLNLNGATIGIKGH